MRLLHRNPILRFLIQIWWLPLLVVLLWGLKSGQPALGWAGLAAYLGLMVGLIGVAQAQIGANVARERTRHRKAEHRFLCSACLHTDEFRYACPACGVEVDARIALSGDLLGQTCPACSHRWSTEAKGEPGLSAYCGHCRTATERARAHERKLRIRGTVSAVDFRRLAEQAEATEVTVAGVRCFVRSCGDTTEWCLCLEDFTRDHDVLPRTHAVHGLTEIWLTGGDPLEMGRVIDHLISRAELREEQLAAIQVSVAAAHLDPAAQRLLSNRFGQVSYGVSAGQFLKLPNPGTAAQSAASPAAERRDVAVAGVGPTPGESA